MVPVVLLSKTAIFVSSVTLWLLYISYVCICYSHVIRESYSVSVANRAMSIIARLHTALWRVRVLYRLHSLLQILQPFMVMSLRGVVLASHVHIVVNTFCNNGASMAIFVYVTATCASVPSYARPCCTSCESS